VLLRSPTSHPSAQGGNILEKNKDRRALTAEQLEDAKRLRAIWLRRKAEAAQASPAMKLTQLQVSQDMGWSNQSAFNQYIVGKIALNLPNLLRFATYFSVDPSEISPTLAEQLPSQPPNAVAESSPPQYGTPFARRARVPLLNDDQARIWLAGSSGAAPADTEAWIDVSKKVGPSAFARKVVGDSMANPAGSPSFPEGMTIIIDPDAKADHRLFVLAQHKETKALIFRQLLVESGTHYLKPLNPQFPIANMDAYDVVGVAVQAMIDLI
jgi:SOS-response transcriptional repressor LexA